MSNARRPLLFLTAKCAVDDVEEGFDIGAKDYLKKPFELRELIVRIRALLRRNEWKQNENQSLRIGEYIFNISTQSLMLRGR